MPTPTSQAATPSDTTSETTATPSDTTLETTATPSDTTLETTATPSDTTLETTATPSDTTLETTATPSDTTLETTATQAITTMFTWRPATDPDPTAALVRSQPLVTTDAIRPHLKDWNSHMLVTPDQWSTWKQAGLSPTGTVALSPEDTPPATDTEAFFVHTVSITIPATIPTERHYTIHSTVTKTPDNTWQVSAFQVTNQEGHSL